MDPNIYTARSSEDILREMREQDLADARDCNALLERLDALRFGEYVITTEDDFTLRDEFMSGKTYPIK